jgi:shikimate dehydrogenase
MSPIMHNAAFKIQGLPYRYMVKLVHPDNLEEVVESLRCPEILGANVTIPYKTEIMKYLDHISNTANEIRAVNTVINRNGILHGTNTDAEAGVRALEEEYGAIINCRILVLGAGGAARAITYKLAEKTDKLTILNRSLGKAKELAGYLNEMKGAHVDYGSLDELESKIRSTEILINATSLGMYPDIDITPVKHELLHRDLMVYDLIYNPIETRLLKEAREAEAMTLSGVKMLVYQGALAYKKWTGQIPPEDYMLRIVTEALGGTKP